MTEDPRQPESGGMPAQPPTSPPAGYGEPAYQPPGGYGDPAYQQPGSGQPVSGEPGYPLPPFGQPGTGDPAYAPPGEPGVGQSGFGQPGVGVPGIDPLQPGFGGPQQPPTPPAPGYRGGGLQSFDPKTVDPLDWGIIAAGVIAFIFSTFNFFTYKVEIAGFATSKASFSAWHGGLAPIAILLAIAAAVLLAVEVIAKARMAFPVRLVVLGAFALASLLLLLALFVVPGNTGGLGGGAFGIKIDKGHGIGYWVSLLAVLAGTGLSLKRFADTGGKLPARS